MEEREWWRDEPCPLNPSWELDRRTELDLSKLKRTIDTDDNVKQMMVVENLIYRAFLKYHERGIFYSDKTPKRKNALQFLNEAETYANVNLRENPAAKIGYGIVINAFRLWMDTSNKQAEFKLRVFVSMKPDHPEHRAYISVTHAYILSRLEPRVRRKSLSLYEEALRYFPRNCQWLFGKALMIGREVREAFRFIGRGQSLPADITRHINDLFRDERDILRNILDMDPTHNLARAHYAQSLYEVSHSDRRAREEMNKALRVDPQNRTICILAARLFRRKGPFREAERILKDMQQRCNIAEVHCQLGYLYANEARRSNNEPGGRGRDALREQALSHFQEALELNENHTASLIGEADMHVHLGNTKMAYDIYKDYLDLHDYKECPYLAGDEYRILKSALENDKTRSGRHIFSSSESVDMCYRLVCLAIHLTAAMPAPVQNPESLTVDCIRELEYHSSREQADKGIRLTAKLKLADAKFRLGNHGEALKLYTTMYENDKGGHLDADIIWGLGNCYFRAGLTAGNADEQSRSWTKSLQMADELARLDRKNGFSPRGLRADVFLGRVKSAMAAHDHPLEIADVGASRVIEPMRQAVESGSLEASYIYLNKFIDLRKHFFSYGVPTMLAHIIGICDAETPLHAEFDTNQPDCRRLAGLEDTKAKQDIVRKLADDLASYDLDNFTDSEKDVLSAIFQQLSDMRRNRVMFELGVIGSRTAWGDDQGCRSALIATLRSAREVLDTSISVCQKTFMKEIPNDSIFRIQFDWKEGKVDPAKARREVEKWARNKTFRDHLDKLPRGILEEMIKIQPMYDEGNVWLAALGSFNTLVKHKRDDLKIDETFTLNFSSKETKPSREPLQLNMRDIIEKSCKHVERLVLEIVKQSREGSNVNAVSAGFEHLSVTQDGGVNGATAQDQNSAENSQ